MSARENKVVVLKRDTVVASPREPSDRDYWMEFRQGLLQQLAAIEKRLGISRRCRHCGQEISSR